MRRLLIAPALCAALVGLAGCGSRTRVGDRIPGTTLTIYSSVPLDGASRVSGRSIVDGETLALAQRGGRIGRYQIVLRSLDDSTVQRGAWDPGQTTANARLAVQDPTTIGYIGEFNSGASAVSIPVLNRPGIAQISPASTAVGLTSDAPGTSPGEPQKYYPTGSRTFARVVPNDTVHALSQVRLQKRLGCLKSYVLDDGEVDGQDMASSFSLAAQAGGLAVAGTQSFDPGALDYSSLIAGVAQTGADCVLISATTEDNAVLLTTQVAELMPAARIFAASGVAESTYTDRAEGGIPSPVDPRVTITVAALDPKAYPPAGQAFFAAYSRQYGAPQPYAIFGYEAMALMLDAISRATAGGSKAARRSDVVSAIFRTRNRASVLGTYGIDRNGDTTLRSYGAYRVIAGQLSFWRMIQG